MDDCCEGLLYVSHRTSSQSGLDTPNDLAILLLLMPISLSLWNTSDIDLNSLLVAPFLVNTEMAHAHSLDVVSHRCKIAEKMSLQILMLMWIPCLQRTEEPAIISAK